jgi:hypothetical protein
MSPILYTLLALAKIDECADHRALLDRMELGAKQTAYEAGRRGISPVDRAYFKRRRAEVSADEEAARATLAKIREALTLEEATRYAGKDRVQLWREAALDGLIDLAARAYLQTGDRDTWDSSTGKGKR